MSTTGRTKSAGSKGKQPSGAERSDQQSVAARTPASSASIQWDDSKMVTNFADVVNLQSTREQMCLFFGMNQSWSSGKDTADKPVRVELNNRIILSPHAAKRLSLALNDILEKYESRFGELKL